MVCFPIGASYCQASKIKDSRETPLKLSNVCVFPPRNAAASEQRGWPCPPFGVCEEEKEEEEEEEGDAGTAHTMGSIPRAADTRCKGLLPPFTDIQLLKSDLRCFEVTQSPANTRVTRTICTHGWTNWKNVLNYFCRRWFCCSKWAVASIHFCPCQCNWSQHVSDAQSGVWHPDWHERCLSFPGCCLTLGKSITPCAHRFIISKPEAEVAEMVIVLPCLTAAMRR